MIKDNFEEDGLFNRLVVIKFRQSQQQGRDQVVEHLVVVLLLGTRCEATVYRHIYINIANGV